METITYHSGSTWRHPNNSITEVINRKTLQDRKVKGRLEKIAPFYPFAAVDSTMSVLPASSLGDLALEAFNTFSNLIYTS